MRTTLSLLSPLATAVLFAAAVTPASAQHAAAPDHVRPVVGHAAVAAAPAPLRTVAVYRFGASREAGLPSQVTVADSAGRLVASYRLPGSVAARPMMVDVLDTDIILQGATPTGMLTIVLYGQNDPVAAGAIDGRWSLGEQHGALRVSAAR
jgi:hypothetical protein